MAVISFDHHTIFPLSKRKYVSPWGVTNITYLIEKFLLNDVDLYCKYIDSDTPRIIDQNYDGIIHGAICGYLPEELPHIIKKDIPVEKKTVLEKLFNKPHVFQNIDDLVEFENKEWDSLQFERRINKALLPLSHNMYEIFYLSCDFIITERLSERNKYVSKNYKEDEGLLKLVYFNKNGDDVIELEEIGQCAIELPEFAILYKFAKIKLRQFSPEQIAGFFEYHYRNSDWSVYHYIELSNRMADELYFNKKETPQNLEYQLAFKKWLNDKVESKKLDSDRFSESVKSKLSIGHSDQEKPTTGVQPPQRKNKAVTGFDLGFTDEQLTSLYKTLVDEKFLDRKTKLEHFKNAFNGEELKENFKPIKWMYIPMNEHQ